MPILKVKRAKKVSLCNTCDMNEKNITLHAGCDIRNLKCLKDHVIDRNMCSITKNDNGTCIHVICVNCAFERLKSVLCNFKDRICNMHANGILNVGICNKLCENCKDFEIDRWKTEKHEIICKCCGFEYFMHKIGNCLLNEARIDCCALKHEKN